MCSTASICKLAYTKSHTRAAMPACGSLPTQTGSQLPLLLNLLHMPFRQAVDIAQLPRQSVGHSVNIMSAKEGRVANVEVGPGSVASVQAVTNSTLFHANSFLRLRVPEVPDPSSTARLARAAQMKVGPDCAYGVRTAGGCQLQVTLAHDMGARGQIPVSPQFLPTPSLRLPALIVAARLACDAEMKCVQSVQ